VAQFARFTDWKIAFGEYVHLKELAPFAHEVLLAGDLFEPLAVVCVRCRPERHLVEFPSQVHKRE
jgi:hypothetical protein